MSSGEFVKDKSIVITGGTTGLGLAFIRECLEHGAMNVAVLDIHDVEKVIDKLQKEFSGQKVMYFKTDVADKKNVRESFRLAKEAFGVIDVVIGNAGIFDESRPEKTIMINLIGMMHSTYEAIDHMSISSGGKGGVIVNMGSVLGLDSMHSGPSYVASKHGVLGFMKSLGTDFYEKLHGIKFVTLLPGFTDTTLSNAVRPDQMPFGIGFEEIQLAYSIMPMQSASGFAKVAIDILNKPKNGSFWIIDDSKPKELPMKPIWKKF